MDMDHGLVSRPVTHHATTPDTAFTRGLGLPVPTVRPSSFPVAVFDRKIGEFTTTPSKEVK